MSDLEKDCVQMARRPASASFKGVWLLSPETSFAYYANW